MNTSLAYYANAAVDSQWVNSTVTFTPTPQPWTFVMPDTTEKKPKLSADEKLIVAALKGSKTQEQITTLIAISRLTSRTPAQVMEIMDDVQELVKDRVGAELPAPSV